MITTDRVLLKWMTIAATMDSVEHCGVNKSDSGANGRADGSMVSEPHKQRPFLEHFTLRVASPMIDKDANRIFSYFRLLIRGIIGVFLLVDTAIREINTTTCWLD